MNHNREHELKTRLIAIGTGAAIFLAILLVAVLLNQVTALIAMYHLLPQWAIVIFHLLEGLMIVVDALGLAWVVIKHLLAELGLLGVLANRFNR